MMNQTQAWPSIAVWAVHCHGPAFMCGTHLSGPPTSPDSHCPKQPTSTAGVGQGFVPCVQNGLSLPDPAMHVPSPAHGASPGTAAQSPELSPLARMDTSATLGPASHPG